MAVYGPASFEFEVDWRTGGLEDTFHSDAIRSGVLGDINLLATDFFFQILAHPLFKM